MSGNRGLKRLLSGLMALVLCSGAFAIPPATSAENYVMPTISYTKQKTYAEYFEDVRNAQKPAGDVLMTYKECGDEAQVEVKNFESRDAVVWSNEDGYVTYTVDVPQTGAYNIEACYYPIVGGNTTTEISLLIDGESPYDTASRIELPRRWHSKTAIEKNKRGNETRPPQVEEPDWVTSPFKDADGLFNEPLYFILEEGTHEITLKSERASLAFEYIKLYQYENAEAYVQPSEAELAKNAGTPMIRLQGENFTSTSSQELFPTYDRGNYLTEDHEGNSTDPVKERYNTVGSDTWDTSGQTITWTMDVPADGWYKVGIKARQDDMRGFYSNRRLYVDGKVPSAPFEQIKFYYSNDWEMTSPVDETGAPAYMYLTKGTHELSLEAVPGEIGESMMRLDAVVEEANDLYLKILMITGPNPDKYTDYYVHKEIPELVGSFTRLSEALRSEQERIESLSNSTGSEATTLARLADVLDKCVKKPNKIPNYISNGSIKDNIASVSSWMKQYRMQPLEVDFIEIAPSDAQFSPTKESFFKAIGYAARGFVGSFFEDYTVLSDSTENSVIVWCGLGRDQTTVVKQLTESVFIPESGVDVSINLVQGTIMEAVLAGKGPDVAMFVGGEFPVNLAIRGLVKPLDDM
ncbi:MAG: ABC transporter substrate-binding protein, partial [Oscillospiraceae bacterium]|nr:ABC transporter substrate-binding protein [Oscillospiraceae bacterium]